jgi:hypothetical protein
MDEQTPADQPPGVRQSSRSPAGPCDEVFRAALTPEAQALVDKAAHGGVPLYTTANLARIAEENGVAVSAEMTPNQIIDALRRRGGPGEA